MIHSNVLKLTYNSIYSMKQKNLLKKIRIGKASGKKMEFGYKEAGWEM